MKKTMNESTRRFVVRGAGILAASLWLAGGAVAAEKAPATSGYRVTFLLYSGRPNPTIEVTSASEVTALEAQLGRSSEGRADAAESAPILGYNGVLIEPRGDTSARVLAKGRKVQFHGALSVPVSGALAARRTVGAASDKPQSVEAGDDSLETFAVQLGRQRGVLDAAALAHIARTR